MSIPDDAPTSPSAAWPRPAPGGRARLSPEQARLWFADRQRRGFNAAIVSLIGATDNGAPSDDGATFDGLMPFVGGDVLRWREPYWARVTAYLRMAADHGTTVMLYPVDGWTIGHAFVPASTGQCHAYGAMVARRLAELPNIVWMSGGDYVPAADDLARGSDADHCIDAMMRGSAGPGRPAVLHPAGGDQVGLHRQPLLGAQGGLELRLHLPPTRPSAGRCCGR